MKTQKGRNMIIGTINPREIKITGHSNNEPCSRISTTAQIQARIMSDCIDTYKHSDGFTHIKFKDLPKKHVVNFNKFCLCYEDLQRLYPNMIRLEIENLEDKK